MNVLFLTIGRLTSISSYAIYTDLLRQFLKEGHNVYTVSAYEKRYNKRTELIKEGNALNLHVKIGNITKSGMIEKGISTLLIPYHYKKAIKKFFRGVDFDLILYSTPPITLFNVVSYLKKQSKAITYLLLKDIFPQNAVDIGMLTKSGAKSIVNRMFCKKEEKLYKISDFIGCMSQANVDYVLKHNLYINPDIVHVNPNSIEVREIERDNSKKKEIYNKYNIPQTATTFIYGGNLGKPQGIPFVIECLKVNVDKLDRFFVICGTGTEYPKLKAFMDEYKPTNVLLINGLPKAEYEDFVKVFDIGLIFLDHRFTIPNFPSRLLSYMQSKMPVLACTDPNTDIGKVITENDFGWWCESNNVEDFTKMVETAISADIAALGAKGFEYLKENYTSDVSYRIIIECINIELGS